jgi:hypothetical protein
MVCKRYHHHAMVRSDIQVPGSICCVDKNKSSEARFFCRACRFEQHRSCLQEFNRDLLRKGLDENSLAHCVWDDFSVRVAYVCMECKSNDLAGSEEKSKDEAPRLICDFCDTKYRDHERIEGYWECEHKVCKKCIGKNTAADFALPCPLCKKASILCSVCRKTPEKPEDLESFWTSCLHRVCKRAECYQVYFP